MYDIITIGSATVDVFADTSSQLVKFITNKGEKDLIAYPSGTKLLINDLQFSIGGGGTNTAVSFSRLGLKTGFLGKLGSDENSFKVQHLLDDEGIDFLGAREGQTGYSIILDSIEHDRTILTYKGSNNTLREQDINPELLETKWMYSSSMVEESFQTLQTVFTTMHEKGVQTAFNPSSYQAKQGLAKLQPLLNACSVIILNLEEAQLLLGKQGEAQTLAPLLAQGTDRIIVITDGSKGAYCFSKGQFYTITPTPHLQVIESTGAGDAFASGFVAGLYKELDIPTSLKLGMIQAESVIQAKGAKNNLLTYDQAQEEMTHFQGRLFQQEIHDIPTPKELLAELEHRYQYIAPQGKEFHFSNGTTIHSLEELAYYLKFALPETVQKHIREQTNDFAEWIRGVFELEELANNIQYEKDQFVISNKLIKFIHTT